MDVASRFWAKVSISNPQQCWPWLAAKNRQGYGCFRIGSRKDGSRSVVLAHRFAYELVKGKIPLGLELDHLCRNPACVNPNHLEIVNRSENTLRGNSPKQIANWQSSKTHCPQGHPYDADNTRYYRGWRRCIACQNIRNQLRHRKNSLNNTA